MIADVGISQPAANKTFVGADASPQVKNLFSVMGGCLLFLLSRGNEHKSQVPSLDCDANEETNRYFRGPW